MISVNAAMKPVGRYVIGSDHQAGSDERYAKQQQLCHSRHKVISISRTIIDGEEEVQVHPQFLFQRLAILAQTSYELELAMKRGLYMQLSTSHV